jgi:hypothetical protein
MAALDFPSSPTNGQGFVSGTTTWTYSSAKGVWNITSNGPLGVTGYTGSQGVIGYNGSLGYTGSQGTGYTGSAGAFSAIGYTGSGGYTGSAGAGYTGSAGVNGYTGSQGTGYTGSAGAGVGASTNTQILFNDSASSNGTSNFVYNKVTNVITASANIAMANAYLSALVLKAYAEDKTVNATATGTVTLDLSTTNVFDLTLTGNVTFAFSNPAPSSRVQTFTIIAKQDVTGGRTVTWPATISKYAGGNVPPATTTTSAIDIWTITTYDGGTTYVISLSVKDVK